MIGVISNKTESDIVQEFFQLFKTPWEIFKEDKFYDVIICTKDLPKTINTKLLLFYSSERNFFDKRLGFNISYPQQKKEIDEVIWKNASFPIYLKKAIVKPREGALIKSKNTNTNFATKANLNNQVIVRFGFDLFQEVSFLLSNGQPVIFSSIPTLEIHIDIIRNLFIENSIKFLEIPPAPFGYSYITCLTHDIDFVSIRNNLFTQTFFGFVFRAIFITIVNSIQGKCPWKTILKNFHAILSLPAIFFGIKKDFWNQFDKYLEIEKGKKSTYFFLPSPDNPGLAYEDKVIKKRASRYNITKLEKDINKILSNDCEIGLHGIDAWNDSYLAKEECKSVSCITKKKVNGIRIHWLFFDKDSHKKLENAGFLYDTTCGYNDSIGFFSGTAQPFRPLNLNKLIELPLIIQDTAMFYSKRMNLTIKEAENITWKIISSIFNFGGVLVVNWHGRSIAPERNWLSFYVRLLEMIQSSKVWFASGTEAAQWFNKRRRITYKYYIDISGSKKIRIESLDDSSIKTMSINLYGEWKSYNFLKCKNKNFIELPLNNNFDIEY